MICKLGGKDKKERIILGFTYSVGSFSKEMLALNTKNAYLYLHFNIKSFLYDELRLICIN